MRDGFPNAPVPPSGEPYPPPAGPGPNGPGHPPTGPAGPPYPPPGQPAPQQAGPHHPPPGQPVGGQPVPGQGGQPYPPSGQPGPGYPPPGSPPPPPGTPGGAPRRKKLSGGLIALIIVGAVVLVCGGLGGTGLAYAFGAFADDGRFASVPNACALLDKRAAADLTPDPEPDGSAGKSAADAVTVSVCEIRPRDPDVAGRGMPAIWLTTYRYGHSGPDDGPKRAHDFLIDDSKCQNTAGSPKRVPGLGDEALIRANDPYGNEQQVCVDVRADNVVIHVAAEISSYQSDQGNNVVNPPPIGVAEAVAKGAVKRLPDH